MEYNLEQFSLILKKTGFLSIKKSAHVFQDTWEQRTCLSFKRKRENNEREDKEIKAMVKKSLMIFFYFLHEFALGKGFSIHDGVFDFW